MKKNKYGGYSCGEIRATRIRLFLCSLKFHALPSTFTTLSKWGHNTYTCNTAWLSVGSKNLILGLQGCLYLFNATIIDYMLLYVTKYYNACA